MAYNLQAEVWSEWTIGVIFLMLRLYARHQIVGFRNFRIDDFLTVMGMLFFTAVNAEAYVLTYTPSPIGLTVETAAQLSPAEIVEYTKGGKLLFTGWLMYIFFLWSLKAVLLTLYFRMAASLPRELMYVRIVTALVVAAFLACFLTHFCQCTPIEHNWQINPYPGDQCVTRNTNYYVIATSNIATDIAIMLLPLPILAKTSLSTFRKALLALLLSSGVFIMICSVLRAYYSLKSISLLPVAIGWISREMMVACIAVSAPAIKPLFNNVKWLRGSSVGHSSKTPGPKASSNLRTIGGTPHYIEMDSKVAQRSKTGMSHWQITRGDSEEDIIKGRNSNENKEGIQVTTEYAVGVETSSSGTSRTDRTPGSMV